MSDTIVKEYIHTVTQLNAIRYIANCDTHKVEPPWTFCKEDNLSIRDRHLDTDKVLHKIILEGVLRCHSYILKEHNFFIKDKNFSLIN